VEVHFRRGTRKTCKKKKKEMQLILGKYMKRERPGKVALGSLMRNCRRGGIRYTSSPSHPRTIVARILERRRRRIKREKIAVLNSKHNREGQKLLTGQRQGGRAEGVNKGVYVGTQAAGRVRKADQKVFYARPSCEKVCSSLDDEPSNWDRLEEESIRKKSLCSTPSQLKKDSPQRKQNETIG